MKGKAKFFTTVILGFLLSTATSYSRETKRIRLAIFQKDTIEESLNKNIPLWMAEHKVPCVGVGLIENGKIKFLKVYGNLKKGHPAPEKTIFNIASQTKPVVAMLTLKLVQAGKWNLDEPLSKYWIDPDVAADSNLTKLTTRHVLSHQTGFPNWRKGQNSNKLKFYFEPGTQFQYSGEGYKYLAKALERKFQKPLEELLVEFLFKPASIRDTRHWGKGLDTSRFAKWHDAQGIEYPFSNATGVSAADDLTTTIGDYCKLGIYLMNGAGLSISLYKEMVSPQVKAKEGHFRALGWGLVNNLPNGEFALEHGGSDIGVRTMAIFLPKSKRGIVVMTNGDNGLFIHDRIIKESLLLGKDILSIIKGARYSPKRIVLQDRMIESYVGMYRQESGKLLYITKDRNAIKVSSEGAPTALFFPESKNKFFLQDYPVQIEFHISESNKPSTLIMYESGKQVMELIKVGAKP